jgi:hypothetical protein
VHSTHSRTAGSGTRACGSARGPSSARTTTRPAVEDLALERDGAEDAVERADAIGDDDEATPVTRSCSCRGPCPRTSPRGRRKVRVRQAVRQSVFEDVPGNHGESELTSAFLGRGRDGSFPRGRSTCRLVARVFARAPRPPPVIRAAGRALTPIRTRRPSPRSAPTVDAIAGSDSTASCAWGACITIWSTEPATNAWSHASPGPDVPPE